MGVRLVAAALMVTIEVEMAMAMAMAMVDGVFIAYDIDSFFSPTLLRNPRLSYLNPPRTLYSQLKSIILPTPLG